MSFQSLNCDARSIRKLEELANGGRLFHACIFAGSGGADKAGAAREFVKAVQCAGGKPRPCDRCLSCRNVDHGNHEVLIYLKREGNSIVV
jgi:DNA polymerase-3 subunit delta'